MTKRIERINQLLLEELARLIQEEFVGQFVTVTAVETTPDLKNSTVWISTYQQDEKKILEHLAEKIPFFQSYLGRKLFLKNIPRLSFELDRSFQRAAKIDKILNSQ